MKCNKILDIFIFILSHLTSWIYIINILYLFGFLKEYYFDIIFLNIFMIIGSIILVYIHPRKFKNKYFNLEGCKLKIYDLLIHHIPALIFIFWSNDNIIEKKNVFYILPLIYFIFFDLKKIYGLENIYGYIGLIILMIIYYLYPI